MWLRRVQVWIELEENPEPDDEDEISYGDEVEDGRWGWG